MVIDLWSSFELNILDNIKISVYLFVVFWIKVIMVDDLSDVIIV